MADEPLFGGLAIYGADGTKWLDSAGGAAMSDGIIMLLANVVQPSKMFQFLVDAFAFAKQHGGDPTGFPGWPLPVVAPTPVKWKLKTTIQKARYYDAPSLNANTVGWLYPGDVVEQIGQSPATGSPMEWIQHSRGWTAAMLLVLV